MKKTITLFLYFLFISIILDSQTVIPCTHKAGVFFTSDAFMTNVYSDSICLDTKGCSIKSGNNQLIIINSPSGKKKYKLSELTGYSDGKNKYKYFYDEKNEDAYFGYFKIEEAKGIIIYSQWYIHGGPIFFYSKSFEGTIKLLNKKNLEKDFPKEDFIKELKSLADMQSKREVAMKVNDAYEKYFGK